jgi:hypothetical protein
LRPGPAISFGLVLLFTFAAGCQGDKLCPCPQRENESELYAHLLPAGAALVEERNGHINSLSLAFVAERGDHPGLVALRERERLDQVVAPGKDEFERLRLLCDWTNSQWKPSTPAPYPPWDANKILHLIRSGQTGGFCAQYAVVMVQACLAMGGQARYLELSPGYERGDGHFTVEIWSNQYNQWIYLDPYYDIHFERKGRPLSALEIHEALVQGRTEELRMVPGHGLNAATPDDPGLANLLPRFLHLAVDLRTDHLSRPYHFWDRRNTYLAWKDRATNGNPHLFLRSTCDPQTFNFPLNQVHVRLGPGAHPHEAVCLIRSNMPGLAGLRLRRQGTWEKMAPPFPFSDQSTPLNTALDPIHGQVMTYHWDLKPGTNRLELEALNLRDVPGPATVLVLDYHPEMEK